MAYILTSVDGWAIVLRHRQESIRGGGTRGLLRRHLHRAGLWRRLLLTHRPLARRLLAEFVGTALLVTIVVGSGIAAERLSPGQAGLQLLENSTATALGLAVLILTLGPVSGGHFNPVISAVDWIFGRRSGSGLTPRVLAGYAVAQLAGGVAGAALANLMYELPALELRYPAKRRRGGVRRGRRHGRSGHGCVRAGPQRPCCRSALAVGAYIGAAYLFTSYVVRQPGCHGRRGCSRTRSRGSRPGPFRLLSPFSGRRPVGAALVLALYPDAADAADDVVVPHDGSDNPQERRPLHDRPAECPLRLRAQRGPLADGSRAAATLAGDAVEVRSAGTAPADDQPRVVAAMKRVGLDLSEGPEALRTTRCTPPMS